MTRFDVAGSMLLHPAGRGLHKRLRYSEESLIDKASRLMRPTPRFEARVEDVAGLVVIRLKGELDITQVSKLMAVHQQAADMGPTVLDLGGLTFMDLAAFRYLLDLQWESDQTGHTVILTGAAGGVRRLFDLMGAQHLLTDPDTLLCTG